ncbi:putative bifunctional diguanylate cyclase/phosphodiesterase [Asanoa ferruginea]|uniref:putative bifunctional diguanylate cyclase/phosphodiesterase n=1 Tax=Asanoa ferruginea TaxID=53367 RepID=UPI0011C1C7D2|nr:EAL domain-containing protein [Asanoa ferruginea]
MRRRGIALACLMAVFTALFYGFPDAHLVTWAAIGLTSAAGIAAGVVANRPRARAPWLLLAGAVVAFTLGDTAYNVLTRVLGYVEPFPSVADAIYLGVFVPLLIAALVTLTRTGAPSRDRASVLDALVFTASAGLLFWILLIQPQVGADAPLLDRGISAAYPICDVLLLAVTARLVAAVRWSPAVVLLGVGGFGLLIADVLYGLAQTRGSWQIGGPVDLGWVAFYACVALAALHPSMRQLTAPRPIPPAALRPGRLLVLGLSTLIAPVAIVVQVRRGATDDVIVAAVVAAAMFLLVIARLYGAMNVHRAAVTRERTLRRAATDLVTATTAADIESTMRAAFAGLLPPGTAHVVLRQKARSGLAVAGSDVRLIARADLPETGLPGLDDFNTIACAPLVVAGSTSSRDHGSLLVAAESQHLIALHDALPLLAANAASALDRITLNEEVNRKSTEAYFRTLVQNASDVILIVDVDLNVRYASPSASTVFGPADLSGRNLDELISARPQPGSVGVLPGQWTVERPDGECVHLEASVRDLRHEPTVDGLVVTLRDVTSHLRMQAELTRLAYHDELTGLANRVLFQARVDEALQQDRTAEAVVAILFVDVDDFKVVNDTLGHSTGDELLRAVSQRLREAVGTAALPARLGGDEFAVLVQTTPVTAVEELADRIVALLNEPFLLEHGLVHSNVSIGIATTADATDGADLLRQSDMALYLAKANGKNQWKRYEEATHAALLRRMQIRVDLDEALRTGAFLLEYQPVIDLKTGVTAGFEALVRWHHPSRGTIAPAEFIDVAEESGLIVPLGEWILNRAIAEAASWAKASATPPYVGVNVSARQLRQPGFVDTVLTSLRRHGLAPDRLVIEITESLLLTDQGNGWSDLRTLREAGVRVAIDDFGTGYSSLSYLRQVPADILKIERSFIGNTPHSDKQRALVDGIVRLATTLDLAVVAEGIEQPAERDVLAKVGCRYGQGYLFSPPLDSDSATRWLQRDWIPA